MYKYFSFLAGILLFLATGVQAQKPPCSGNAVIDLTPGASISQSSYFDVPKHCEANHSAERAAEPIHTRLERNPWFELDLKSSASLSAVQISYPVDAFMDGFQEYYVLFSQFPIEHTDLAKALANPAVDHIFISEPLPSGMVIPLENRNARYVRIQSAQESALFCSKISLLGSRVTAEIAGNNIDDDCDGKVDNTDEDAKPVFRNLLVIPGNQEGQNGSITVETGGENLQYSLDGGQTFQKPTEYDGNYMKISAPAGTHNLVISNPEGVETPYQYNPVVVAAPEMTSCGNGDFLDGWTGWTGWLGAHHIDGTLTIDNNNIDPVHVRHAIIQSGSANDPWVGTNIPLSSPNFYGQFARLGSIGGSNGNAQGLNFCFQVTPANAQFTFSIAAVLFHLDNEDHTPLNIRSFFGYAITNAAGQVIDTRLYRPGPGQNTQQFDPHTYYLPWTCISNDLTQYIGQQVCVTFVSAGCGQGGHGAYAYIDGLCNNLVLPTLSMPNSVCYPGNTINATPAGGSGISKYQWQVEKIDDNGNTIAGSVAQGPIQTTVPIAPLTDVIKFWQDRVSNPRVYCGQRYRVTLYVTPLNSCAPVPVAVSAVFTANCQPTNLINYCDLIVCDNHGPVQMQPSGSCSTCSFSWSPSNYLDNSTIAAPTIINNAGFNQGYNLILTDGSNGCSVTKTVNVSTVLLNGNLSVVSKCHDKCSIVLEATYSTTTTEDPSLMTAVASSTSPNESHILEFTSKNLLPNGVIQYKFESSPIENKGTGQNGQNPIVYQVKLAHKIPTGGNYCQTGSCTNSVVANISVPRGLFWGTPNVFIPNTFCATAADPANRVFNPFFSNGISAPGVYWIKMQIFDEWGEMVYSKEESLNPDCNTTSGLKGNEPGFPWNGRKNNDDHFKLLHSGVYTFVIQFENCVGTTTLSGSVTFLNSCN